MTKCSGRVTITRNDRTARWLALVQRLRWAVSGFVLPVKLPPKEQPEKVDARLWRVSASSGTAAPLGCENSIT